MVFDYSPGDVFGCLADIGWITGHSYVVYGPLSNGATSVLFESTPTYPDPSMYGILLTYITYFKSMTLKNYRIEIIVLPTVIESMLQLVQTDLKSICSQFYFYYVLNFHC